MDFPQSTAILFWAKGHPCLINTAGHLETSVLWRQLKTPTTSEALFAKNVSVTTTVGLWHTVTYCDDIYIYTYYIHIIYILYTYYIHIIYSILYIYYIYILYTIYIYYIYILYIYYIYTIYILYIYMNLLCSCKKIQVRNNCGALNLWSFPYGITGSRFLQLMGTILVGCRATA